MSYQKNITTLLCARFNAFSTAHHQVFAQASMYVDVQGKRRSDHTLENVVVSSHKNMTMPCFSVGAAKQGRDNVMALPLSSVNVATDNLF